MLYYSEYTDRKDNTQYFLIAYLDNKHEYSNTSTEHGIPRVCPTPYEVDQIPQVNYDILLKKGGVKVSWDDDIPNMMGYDIWVILWVLSHL